MRNLGLMRYKNLVEIIEGYGNMTEIIPNKKGFQIMFESLFVVWAGIEPATQGFSVLCSTN